jgi:hypothetical protein
VPQGNTFFQLSPAGWALITQPTAKERRYGASKEIEILECGTEELLAAAQQAAM